MLRKGRRIAAGILLAMLLALTACGKSAPAPDASGRVIVDGRQREITVPEQVERVVCVGVGALRYTCYMEARDLVVGVEDYETRPGMDRLYSYVNFERFAGLPVIGTNGEPSAEAIIAADPQVIVLSASAKADPDDLQSRTGIPVVTVPGSDTTLDEQCYETLRILGELYGRQDRAAALTEELRGIAEDLTKRVSDVPAEDRPTAYVCGVSFRGLHGFEGTEAHYGPFVLIGANNPADSTGQALAFDIDPEQVLAWDPEVIFVDYTGLPLIRQAYGENPAFYDGLTAVREGRVYAQIPFRSYAANLETALADAYYAATVLYPEAFADIDPEAKAGEIFELLLGANPYQDLKEAGYGFGPVDIKA